MVALIIFIGVFCGLILFAIVRLSISLVFWCSKQPEDRKHALKMYFPYYIIIFFALCISVIVISGFEAIVIYMSASLYVSTLLIWWYIMRQPSKIIQNKDFAVEPNHPKLP